MANFSQTDVMLHYNPNMKNILLFFSFLLITFLGTSQESDSASLSHDMSNDILDGLTIGIAYDWDQLDEIEQSQIETASKKHLKALVDKDVTGFWQMCHSKFKKSIPPYGF